MMARLEGFARDRRGATAIEYGLIAALIAVGIVGGVGQLGAKTGDAFTTTNSKIQQAQGG